jgi:hypothetical protein
MLFDPEQTRTYTLGRLRPHQPLRWSHRHPWPRPAPPARVVDARARFTLLTKDSLEVLGATVGVSGARGPSERARKVEEGELFGEGLLGLSAMLNRRVG